jgi:hypothetical protein
MPTKAIPALNPVLSVVFDPLEAAAVIVGSLVADVVGSPVEDAGGTLVADVMLVTDVTASVPHSPKSD